MTTHAAQRTPVWDWTREARALGMSANGDFNAGSIKLPARICVAWYRTDGTVKTLSGQELIERAAGIACVLERAGVSRGDRVAGLLGRRPDVFATALAVWRLGAIYVPLFSGFGGDGLRVRLVDSGATTAVTDIANRPALGRVQESGVDLTVLVVGGATEADDVDIEAALERGFDEPKPVRTHVTDTATIMYTSGTTGTPKGCTMPHGAVLSLMPYVRHCLDMGQGDVLFSGADAGWSFGLLTTGLSPMAAGVTRVIYEGPFDPAGWWKGVDATRAGHVAAAPTAFRHMARHGADDIPSAFAAATSAGEPMDEPTGRWFLDNAGVAIHDSYGLSELGMVVANLRGAGAADPSFGSMGVPLPGFEVRLLDEDRNPIEGEGIGQLACQDNGFLLSNGYWGRMPEWDSRFVDDWFVTEDLVRRDEQGLYWYVARADDMIVTSGYNVGPYEVETALLDHPSVVEAAATGEHDHERGHEIVVAHVVIDGPVASDLQEQLRTWVGERVGWHAAPRQIRVHDALPYTASGKIRRNALRSGQTGAAT